MSLADKLTAPAVRVSRCLLMRIRDGLPTADAETLDGWLEDGTSSYDISKALAREGFRVSSSSIRLHRTDKCACWGVS